MVFAGGPVEDANEEGQSAKGKGAKSKAKTKGVNEDGDESSGEYAIENAKSSRSTCKSCNEKIDKGQVSFCTCSHRNDIVTSLQNNLLEYDAGTVSQQSVLELTGFWFYISAQFLH